MSRLVPESQDDRSYYQDLSVRFSTDYDRRRRQDAQAVSARPSLQLRTGPLCVDQLELYARDNAQVHHTEQFEQVQDAHPTPVLRRGQRFHCAARFDRAPDFSRDTMRLLFELGPQSDVLKGTRVVLEVTENGNKPASKDEWEVAVVKRHDTILTFQVAIPPTAPVGAWRCVVQTLRDGEHNDFRFESIIFILFNPWCPDDGVYLEDDALRWEYVLNDYGKVWTGSPRDPRGRRWLFGQFDDVVLPVCALLMERSGLLHAQRGDPVKFVRALSAVVNSNDDNGLIVGRWNGRYEDGTAPTAWTGSVAIMERFLNNGHRPVRYGQCWVFSAVTVTMCRALGIPCRSITNYVSAHDTNHSLTVDKFFDRRGNEIRRPGVRDSCWNYHVWNDAWMRRPDLGSEYDGWQVVDATPQEPSEGTFCCGPASVVAVRRGEVGLQYDTPFVYAEVNADVCHFQQDDVSSWGFTPLLVDKYSVGKIVVTKMVGKDDDVGDTDVEDITAQYKPAEGTPQERAVSQHAMNRLRGCRVPDAFSDNKNVSDDVCLELVEIDKVMIGDSFSVVLHIHNKSAHPRSVNCLLSANSVFFNGVVARNIRSVQGEYVIQSGQREALRVQVSPAEYLDKMVEHGLVKIYAMARVQETGQTWSEEDDFELQAPRIMVQPKGGPARVGHECSVTFSFRNPLNVALSSCRVTVEGPGLQRPRFLLHGDVKPGELVSFTEHFYPRKAGERKLAATFNSEQLSGVVGSSTLHVQP